MQTSGECRAGVVTLTEGLLRQESCRQTFGPGWISDRRAALGVVILLRCCHVMGGFGNIDLTRA